LSEPLAKPKVLFIGPYPPPYSGPEMGMKLFLESSLQQSFEIIYLKTNVRDSNVNKGRFDHHMILAFFRFIFQLIFKILRHRPIVAYYPNTPAQLGWIGRDIWCLFICRFFRVKTIIHLRGANLKPNFKIFNPLAKKLVILACRSVSLALVQAECLRDQFEKMAPEERIAVLYNALDSNEYDNDNLDDFDSNQILFMGHMTKAKGYCDLVRAIPIVAKRFPNVRFYFAGTLRKGERGIFFDQSTGNPLKYEDPFKVQDSILSGKYKDNYINLGIVHGQDKKRLLKKTNIFVLPSYSEGFSRAVLEAMSMGKPIVCTPVGAHTEVVQDGINGFVVPTETRSN